MRLTGKRALVTGSTSNIGRAIAVAFGREGAHVVVSGRNAERGAAVVEEIRAAGGTADFVAAELDGSKAASAELARRAGRVDILVNNAGAIFGQTTVDTSEADLDRVYAVNVKAPFFLTSIIAPEMAKAGGGVIINLGSWVARLGIGVGASYAASKGALETLTRAWSAEFGPGGVRVNAISPGVVHGELRDGHPAQPMMKGTPYGAVGDPEAIALAAVYLASDDAAFVHGTVLDVDGGRVGVAVISS
ncbi:MAG TPA: SDR family oxidoreductase [Pseudonocardiaceae bacterium]|jgi:NAD(P)-dependent dehydrogenase (short-subunit alcohol dehydrogenase family)